MLLLLPATLTYLSLPCACGAHPTLQGLCCVSSSGDGLLMDSCIIPSLSRYLLKSHLIPTAFLHHSLQKQHPPHYFSPREF